MSKSNSIDKYRGPAKFVAGFTAAATVGTIIKMHRPDDKITTKIVFALGAFGLGGAAGMAADKYTDSLFDDFADALEAVQDYRDEIDPN